MNTAQNKQLHALLTQTGLMPQKSALVNSFTYGRTEHSKEMNHIEALELIKYLQTQSKKIPPLGGGGAEVMRRKIIAMAHRLGWENANGKVNMQQLDKWMTEKSYLKKKLNQYLYNELPKLVSQFKIMYEYYINRTA